jgi:hypothetical protein
LCLFLGFPHKTLMQPQSFIKPILFNDGFCLMTISQLVESELFSPTPDWTMNLRLNKLQIENVCGLFLGADQTAGQTRSAYNTGNMSGRISCNWYI